MNIIENADMSRYCTYKAGGSARYLISVENIEELREAQASWKANPLKDLYYALAAIDPKNH